MTTGARAVEATAAGQPVLVVRPDPSPGQGSVDMLCTLARARARAAGACFLAPSRETESVAASVASADVPVIHPDGWQKTWLEGRWRTSAVADGARARWRAAAASGLHELYRELRRHAGDQRLPSELRRRLREAGHRSYERSVALRSAQTPYPRRLLRAPSTVAWSPEMLEHARAGMEAAGVPAGVPVVAFEVRTRPDVAKAAIRSLVADGYAVVRIGDPGAGPMRQPGLIDLTTATSRSLRPELVLVRARFAILGSLALQQLAYLTNTPSLTIDAADPFTLYPIRSNGLLLLATAVDLGSGRELPVDEWLTEAYFRNRRNFGYRGVAADELLDAIQEMQEGVAHGWADTDAQRRFRIRVVEAGSALASTTAAVAEWGPDDGFIGDGRLARAQAARTS
jgi:putative glycosyltransferase (TIGR04372 family)